MRLAADLHLHSRFSKGVSPAMTLENIAIFALRKGIDLLGTGDCLQSEWLREIEEATFEAEPGLLALKPDYDKRVWSRVPEGLRRPLRFVLSTEVNCQPPPKGEFEGIHTLIYIRSLESVHQFRQTVSAYGDLSEGRPTLNLNCLELLDRVLDNGENCHFAPAHVFNPWFSALGTVGGESSLDELFVDHTANLVAVETGLTSTPPMCRRVSSLDRHALFSCSDAHSLENLGRECTIVDIEPSYNALFSAIRGDTSGQVVETLKYPLYRTRYFLNWCSECKEPADALVCPVCRRTLTTGSRDRLEQIADRIKSPSLVFDPPHRELLPLAEVVGQLLQLRPQSPVVKRICQKLLETVGHERFVLTSATEKEIARETTPQLARAILAQRRVSTDHFKAPPVLRPLHSPPVQQALFNLGSITPARINFRAI